MCQPRPLSSVPYPLDGDELEELRAVAPALVVWKHDKPYNVESLHTCEGCGSHFLYSSDLDDEGNCDACAEDMAEERLGMRQLVRDYWSSVL